MKSESQVQQEIQIEAAKYGIILMRNNSGALKDETGRVVRYGLGNDSNIRNEQIKSSDLIGIMPVGRFIAIEVKKEGWVYKGDKRELAQKAFIDFVKSKHGVAAFCSSVDDFLRLIGRL